MAIVRSFGTLQSVARPVVPTTVNIATSSYMMGEAFAAIYATQPNVRKCVDFLARNLAQIGYHIFRRVLHTDRVRLPDHELAQWLANPNPYTTQYRLFESLIADLGIYFNAYWLKIRTTDRTGTRIGLVRLPPPMVALPVMMIVPGPNVAAALV